MEVLIYIYNIFLIILYSFTMTLSINNFLKEKNYKNRLLFLAISFYMLFFVLDNLVISMTELITPFANAYNKVFMGASFIKTVIYIGNNYCQLWILSIITKKKTKLFQYIIQLIILIWMVILHFLPNTALKVYLYYLPNQLFLIYIGFLAVKGLNEIKSDRNAEKYSLIIQKYLKWIGAVCIIFGIAILLEDTFVIFNVDKYNILEIKIQNRNICEDIFSIIISILCCYYFIHDYYNNKIFRKEIDESRNNNLYENFFKYYKLTEREKEICELLLEHKQNKEIASRLFLSLGTVKTHIHNIYLKMEINRRRQIFELFEKYEIENINR